MLLGSTASKVIRKGDTPVLIVRAGEVNLYQNVLVSVDFSESSRLALETALRIAPGSSMYTLHAFEALDEASMRSAGCSEEAVQQYRMQAHSDVQRKLDEFLGKFPNATHIARLIEDGYPPAVIRNQALRLRASLIVIGKHGLQEVDKELLGRVTKHVLYETDCDVLVVPGKI